jgi:hypothetical protein
MRNVRKTKTPKSSASRLTHMQARAKSAHERVLRRNSRKDRLMEVLEHRYPYTGTRQRFRGRTR